METRFSVRLIADTDPKRRKGLMFASPLKQDEVALFVFPNKDRYGFWNKNVDFGLSLAFLDETGRIVDTADMDAGDEQGVYPNSHDVRFVVEASQGTFERLGIKKGDLFDYRDNALFARSVRA